jgi:hypothetical protein
MSWKEYLGIVAIIISIAGYYPYLRDLFSGKTKPHAFSWLVWGILTGIAFVAQIINGAGAGAWVQALTLVFCTIIFFASLKYGSRIIKKMDWIMLGLSLSTLIPWLLTKDATLSILLLIAIDFFALVPTLRKTYTDPLSETLLMWQLNTLKHIFALSAMQNYSVTTSAYTIYLIITNLIVVFLIIQRRNFKKSVTLYE